MNKTIIIADDHPFTVEGMQAAIQDISGLEVIGTAANGIEAIGLIKRLKPDCAVLDLSMPGANGLEVFQEAKMLSPSTRFIIITGISAAAVFRQLYEVGIDGLFVKNTSPHIIQQGIIDVCAGRRVISDEAQSAIDEIEAHQTLSSRERDVLDALALGQTNREIGRGLGLSPKTIDTHRTKLMRKMNVTSTAALLVAAMRTGLIE